VNEHFDVLITGARVMDPANGIDKVCDIGIRSGRIAQVGELAGCMGGDVIDAAGCIVTPGLIDAHIHLWPLAHFGVRPESVCFPAGVTTAVDGGSTGCATFEAMRPALTGMGITAKALLHVCAGGLTAFRQRPEDIDPDHFDRANTLRLIQEYPNELKGLKIRMGRETGRELGLSPLKAAVELGREANVPVMMHCTNPALPLGQLIDCLGKGDILTHPYNGHGSTIAEMDALKAAQKARERGVWLDVGDAGWHTSFDNMKLALREGLAPDTISTDATDRGVYRPQGPMHLGYCISKWLNLGMTLEEAIPCVTVNPARMLGLAEEAGSLTVGRWADIAIFRLEEAPTRFYDGLGNEMMGDRRLRTLLTYKKGHAEYRDIGF